MFIFFAVLAIYICVHLYSCTFYILVVCTLSRLLPGAEQTTSCAYIMHNNNNNNNPRACITIEEATQPETRHFIGVA